MNNTFDELMDKCNRLYEQLEDRDVELYDMQEQIDALQKKAHLCAGYDRLEAENVRLREALESIQKYRAKKYKQREHGHYCAFRSALDGCQMIARKVLNPE